MENRNENGWWQITLSSIGDAVIAADAEGCVTFMNAVAQSLTGWRQEEALGKGLEEVFRIVNEETREEVENPATKILREGVVAGLANHTLLIARDGSERAIDDSGAPIRDRGGNIIGVVLVFHNITERRRAERLLEEAQLYAEGIVETVLDPLVVLDAGLRVRTANRSFYQTFHVSPEETENHYLYELGDGQWNIPQLRTVLGEVLTENTSFADLVVDHTFPAIGRRTVLLNARRICREGVQTELILLAIQDITDRTRVERHLKVSELRYRRLFEAARDGILLLAPDTGKITDANPFMTELLGYPHEALLGKELWEIGLLQDQEASQAAFRELQEEGYVRYEDLPLQTREEQRREVEFVSNLYREDGQHVIQCNIRDITERKRLEQALQQRAEELAEADHRKDEFLAMLAHELRNPLAPIRNAVFLLKQLAPSEPRLVRSLEAIDRQVRHQARLLDDLLDVSRISRGKTVLRPERLDLAQLVRDVAEDGRSVQDEAGLTLTLQLPDEPVWVEGDPTRLSQVVGNLLNNATKFTDRGGHVTVRVAVETGKEFTTERGRRRRGAGPRGRHGEKLEEEAWATVAVRDTGIGIEPEMLPHVFETFAQADRSLDRTEGGLGLGLALVKGLVEAHGGEVRAASKGAGRGAEFSVLLPIASAPAASEKKTPPAAPPVRPSRILIVEDHRDAAETLRDLLEMSGYTVAVAYSGSEAVEGARQFRPEVVLCDLGLAGMNGYEVAEALRRDTATATARLIAVSGYGQEEDRQRSQEAGFDLHLTKPVDPAELGRFLGATPEPQRG